MPNSPAVPASIQKTLEDQHRQTMKVVHAIKRDTEALVRQLDTVSDRLSDDLIRAEDEELSDVEHVTTQVTETIEEDLSETRHVDNDIIKQVTRYVLAELEPLLVKLQAVANSESGKPGEAGQKPMSDQELAHRLVETMQAKMGHRRQQIALNKNRLSAP